MSRAHLLKVRTLQLIGDLRDRRLSQPPVRRNGDPPEHRILFVCLGNICRSPTAQAILTTKLARRGLLGRVAVESAGTAALAGRRPHHRARNAARVRGLRITSRARLFKVADFDRFDRIVVFDGDNEAAVLALSRNEDDRAKVERISDADIGDPVVGGTADFERAFDEIDAACERLLTRLTERLMRR